jgi:hypothetical protein
MPKLNSVLSFGDSDVLSLLVYRLSMQARAHRLSSLRTTVRGAGVIIGSLISDVR